MTVRNQYNYCSKPYIYTNVEDNYWTEYHWFGEDTTTTRNVPLPEMDEKVRVGYANEDNFDAKNIVYISHIDDSYPSVPPVRRKVEQNDVGT